MKRFMLLNLIFVLLVALVPMPNGVAYAQDEGLPACNAEEIEATLEGLVILGDTFDALAELNSDPASDDYLTLLAGLDTADYEYWNTFYSELPECLEAQQVSFLFGIIIDETLTVALLYRLGAIQTSESLAGTFTDAADVRLENLLEAIEVITTAESMEDVLPGEWPACSEQEAESAFETLKILYDAGNDVVAIGEETNSFLPIIAGYESLTASFWNDIFPILPQCFEVQAIGYAFGFAGEDILIAISITEIAQYENNAGNTEAAEIFAESAAQRLEDLEETGDLLDELFGEEEMAEEEAG